MSRIGLPVAWAVVGVLVTGPIAPEPSLWSSVRLPGKVAAARTVFHLGDSHGRMDAAGLIDVVRFAHGNNTNPKSVELVDRYITAIDEVQTARRSLPVGIALPSAATPKKVRETLQGFVESVGLRLLSRGKTFVLEPGTSDEAIERVAWMAANGVDVKRIAATASVDAAVSVDLQDSDLPLPLPEFWQQDVFRHGHLPILDIIDDRQSSLLYAGLLTEDDETLGFLAAHPPLVRHLREDHAAVFAAFGRSIRIHGGVVDVPGGTAAVPVWEALVGRAPSDVERFVRDLLAQDDGRLAYFYDTVDHLDRERQEFVLGTRQDASARARSVKQVFDHFAIPPDWRIADRPFHRPALDGALALSLVDVRPDGTAGPPTLPSLLDRAISGGDWPTAADRARTELKPRVVDAAWLLEWVFDTPKDAGPRFELFRRSQRLLAADRDGHDSPFEIELALRTCYEMPALTRALERMGVRDLSTFGQMGLAARRVTQSDSLSAAGPVVARWQAALGLVEQANRLHALPSDTIARLLRSLTEITPKKQDEAAGVIATWIAEQLVPAFVTDPGDSADLELAVVGGLVGKAAPPAFGFSWEGLDYVVDTAGPDLKQIMAIRASQHGPALQDVVALQQVRRQIERGVTSLDQLPPIVAAMTRLQLSIALLPEVNGKRPPVVDDYRNALADLAKIKKATDLKRVPKVLPDVTAAVDAVTDAVIVPLVYAIAAAPTDEPSQIVAAAWRAHTFQPGIAADRRPWTTIAWQTASAVDDSTVQGLKLSGSYLTLDISLSRGRLPQVPIDSSIMSRIGGEDMNGAVEATSLIPDVRSADPDVAAAVASIEAGRKLIAQWTQTLPDRGALRSTLRAAGVDESRTNLVLWTAARDPREAFASLRTTEVLFLGGGTAVPSAFGWPSSRIDGCFCRLAPGGRSPEDMRSRVGTQGAIASADLLLHLAELIATMNLPTRLAPLVLPIMTAEWLSHVRQTADYDWESLAAWPSQVPATQVEEALLHLVTTGVLAPPRGKQGPQPVP